MKERERTCTQRACGANQKEHRTRAAECTNPVEWRTSGHEKGHPDGAHTNTHTSRGTRIGRQRQKRGAHTEAPAPPQPAASATHTRRGYCACQHSSEGRVSTHRPCG